MEKGKFISFEGIDGCGKTTQVKLLYEFLTGEYGKSCVIVREPGGTSEGERIREILLSKESKLPPEAEFFLFLASRSILTKNVIIPSLENGVFVIADRYADSSVAYQGYGRGLDVNFVKLGNSVATYNVVPDLTIYIDISVEEAIKRKKKRDRMEEDTEFLEKVRKGYLELAKENDRFVIINGERSIEKIWNEIKRVVEDRLLRGETI